MDGRDLPTGMLTIYKAATRELVLAVGGVDKVKALTGLSDGVISRCRSDAHGDTLPGWAIFQLEFACQAPVFARALAALTGHRLVPIDGGDEGDGDHVTDLVGVASSAAAVTQTMGAALADGQVTPGEAKAALADIGAHERVVDIAKRRLAAVAARAGVGR